MKKKVRLAVGLCLLALFFLFTWIVKKEILTQFDFNTTVRIQNHIPTRFDFFFSLFSLLGSFEITSLILAFFLVLFKKWRMFLSFILIGFAHIVEIFGKYFLVHPGPPYAFFRYNLDFLFPSAYVQPGSSYPSGHSMRSVFLAILLAYIIMDSKKISLLIKIVALTSIAFMCGIMLLSRVSLGEHWSTDVIGGSILGSAIAFLSLNFLNDKKSAARS